jgi:hypothetical protein
MTSSSVHPMTEKWEDWYGTEWGERPGIVVYRCLLMMVKDTLTQPWQVVDFRNRYGGMIAQFPVDMKRNLEQTLDRIGADNETLGTVPELDSE